MSKDNKSVTLTFSVGDLPMIAHAFSIARATAMCCGHRIAKQRLDQYTKMIEALVPEPAKIFEAEEWAEICICIAECTEWAITIERENWYAGGKIKVRVDGRSWKSDYFKSDFRNNFTEESPEFAAVRDMLTDLAGLDSKQVSE